MQVVGQTYGRSKRMDINILKIKSLMVLKGYNLDEFSKAMGWSRSTLWTRFKKPEDITLAEMNKMIEILEIENPKEVFYD